MHHLQGKGVEMRFILWTLVYWGLLILGEFLYLGFPMRPENLKMLDDMGVLVMLIPFIEIIKLWLYFYLYNKYVKETPS